MRLGTICHIRSEKERVTDNRQEVDFMNILIAST